MEALASPLSLLIKMTPGKGSQGEAPGYASQTGEISQDVFAALLAQQLGGATAGAGADPLALQLPQLTPLAVEQGDDPAAQPIGQERLPEQAVAMLAAQFMVPAPVVAGVVPAATRPEDAALIGDTMPVSAVTGLVTGLVTGGGDVAAVGSMVAAAVSSGAAVATTQGRPANDVVPAAGMGISTAEPAARQMVAAQPASFAAPAVAAAEAEVASPAVQQPALGTNFELPAVAHLVEELPQSTAPVSSGTTFVLPATAARTETPAPMSSNIAAPVTSDIWGQRLGERVVWMVSQQHQGVELHLNPPALGPLEVKLSMNDNQASLVFSTQHAPVREAIEGATARLREMLADSGVNLGSVSVNVGNFSQQQPGNQALADNRSQAQAWNGGSFSAEQPLLPVMVMPLRHNGMVDLYA